MIIKSTIPPGTTAGWNKQYDNVDIVFNPEFLTEANSIEDFKNQNRIIVGGNRPATTKVARIFKKVFPKVPIIKTGSTYAEMVKCEYLDIDYDKVIEYAKHDDRLGYSHWDVPGPDGDVGYGGHCFPKDVRALLHVAMEIDSDIDPIMLQATDKKNNKIRTNKDWLDQKGRAVI